MKRRKGSTTKRKHQDLKFGKGWARHSERYFDLISVLISCNILPCLVLFGDGGVDTWHSTRGKSYQWKWKREATDWRKWEMKLFRERKGNGKLSLSPVSASLYCICLFKIFQNLFICSHLCIGLTKFKKVKKSHLNFILQNSSIKKK